MERKEIHQDISAIVNKINYLNQKLSNEKVIHSVELDLLKSYHNELQELIRNLALQETSTQQETIKPEIHDDTSKNENQTQTREATEEESSEKAKVDNKDEEVQSEEVSLKNEIQEVEKTTQVNDQSNLESKEERYEENSPKPEKPTEPLISPESFNTESDEEKQVSLNEKFKMDSFELADKLKYGGRKNLKEKIDLNQRYIFIQELFEGDAEYFNRSLRELDKCNSMEEAQDYIKTAIEGKYAWEEKQKYATKFIELVLNNFDEINNN